MWLRVLGQRLHERCCHLMVDCLFDEHAALTWVHRLIQPCLQVLQVEGLDGGHRAHDVC